MHRFDFNVRLTSLGRTAADLEAITTSADRALWQSAAQVLHERVYRYEGEAVRVSVDWQPLADREDDAATLTMQVSDGSGRLDVHHALSFAELFLHDAFLLLNIAMPGSFGGAIAIDDDEHVHELALEAYLFEFAWAAANANGWPSIEPLPLPDVIAWYDSLQLGTAQVAPSNTAAALFHLLHLARRSDSEPMSILRAAQALEALFDNPSSFLRSRIEALLGPFPELTDRLDELFTLRNAIVTATAPITHPMHDDSLDPQADAESLDWTQPADFAASVLVAALQAMVRKG